ncbi:MAG: hypothetical protein ACPGLV_14175, partial [Bacteroidia bacterium]
YLADKELPAWYKKLDKSMISEIETCQAFLNNSKSQLYDKDEIKANIEIDGAYADAIKAFKALNFEQAVAITAESIPHCTNDFSKAATYNNLGYFRQFTGQFEKSLLDFEKALEINPQQPFVNDNMAFSLIALNRLLEAKKHLDVSEQLENYDDGYLHRNLACYYWKIGQITKAKQNFELALDFEAFDLIHQLYAKFLKANGDIEQADMHLQLAKENGEVMAEKVLDVF